MIFDCNLAFKELNESFRAAIETGDIELAKDISKTINKLLKYCTGII